ncbi:hypothetical protein NIES806_20100 [Dolichospermum compactum NIES-806]|uniref:Type I restriction enzyme R protein C-terminal domain-containing protein n=1 Tax=Dolichospermum compactum NIES-806 TaxID=1973481 RepID=A0A1Z4V2R2_9CYAN|nr:hypothetical protein NIES806_20100 [Dolichospermum compactum NIES-806]
MAQKGLSAHSPTFQTPSNVAYILNLLRSMNKTDPVATQKLQKEILDLMADEIQLRNKRALIEAFIANNLQQLQSDENVMNTFIMTSLPILQ